MVEESLNPIDLDAAFEESVNELHPDPVKVGWIEVDVATAIKRLSPADWELYRLGQENRRIMPNPVGRMCQRCAPTRCG